MTFDISLHEVCVRVGVRYVITKFSQMDSLPNFLTNGFPQARASRAREPRHHLYPSVHLNIHPQDGFHCLVHFPSFVTSLFASPCLLLLVNLVMFIVMSCSCHAGMHRKHIGLMTSQSAKMIFAQSKTKNPPRHTPPVFLRFKF